MFQKDMQNMFDDERLLSNIGITIDYTISVAFEGMVNVDMQWDYES